MVHRLNRARRSWALVGLLVAASALAISATAASWRLAALAALLAAAIAAGRFRYAPVAAVAVLAGVALLAATGRSAGSDARSPRPAVASDAQERMDGAPLRSDLSRGERSSRSR
jgi:hypothetical protein